MRPIREMLSLALRLGLLKALVGCHWREKIAYQLSSLLTDGRTTKFVPAIPTFCFKCKKLNSSSANLIFVIGTPNLASQPPPPASFPAPALLPTNVVSLWTSMKMYEWNNPALRGAQSSSSLDNPQRQVARRAWYSATAAYGAW
ncbi:GPI-anchored small secreted protein [Laccaria bicolor S238N-H82]|uniref:GPI-anchored small secreted protein n=1 Tax=Laccaria bicolor (strain S238N-H82 / ATCC MYA-4686) TaxID=486041 RepID=B0DL14_LACBS|nr:GPI-anchored small secreted protein [Laccaria bicolor S238N-H82]EDR04833.1 GPI-anchored small secreted protein [Laccaria bicolor S238N-H82]|eukprot:XP_001884657.1 GPI-anchored small secreted protein [Laccaria bicolor S238N-H82]